MAPSPERKKEISVRSPRVAKLEARITQLKAKLSKHEGNLHKQSLEKKDAMQKIERLDSELLDAKAEALAFSELVRVWPFPPTFGYTLIVSLNCHPEKCRSSCLGEEQR